MDDPLRSYSIAAASADAALLEAGDRLTRDPSDSQAFSLIRAAAQRGSSYGLCKLSVYFADEHRASYSPEQALSCARQASSAGFAPGQFLVGWYLQHGIGTEQDLTAAVAQYEAAAEGGYAVAAIHLALLLVQEHRRASALTRAIELVSLAANNGDPLCATQLAQWYEEGAVVPRDRALALRWYQVAADGGSSVAKIRLGMAYATGDLGLPRDQRKANDYLSDD